MKLSTSVVTSQQIGEFSFQMLVVQLRLTFVTMSGDDYYPSVSADPQPDTAQPPLNLVLLLTFTRVPDDEIKSTAAKKELMSDPIYFLTAEIPSTDSHIDVEYLDEAS